MVRSNQSQRLTGSLAESVQSTLNSTQICCLWYGPPEGDRNQSSSFKVWWTYKRIRDPLGHWYG